MADLARILALPPPRSYIPKPGNQLRPIGDARAEGGAAKNLPIGQTGETDASEEAAAQAKRFKYRVHDGAARGAPAADLQRDQARAANRQRLAAQATQAETAQAKADTSAAKTADTGAEPKGIATFLAQLISQERLGQGLHAPPLQAADRAYRRAGGEPALNIGSARFSLAV